MVSVVIGRVSNDCLDFAQLNENYIGDRLYFILYFSTFLKVQLVQIVFHIYWTPCPITVNMLFYNTVIGHTHNPKI